MVGIWSFVIDQASFYNHSKEIAMANNFKVKLDEIGRLTFMRRLCIPKIIGISQY